MNRISALWVACVALLLPAAASAQNYVFSSSPSPYQALPIPGGQPETVLSAVDSSGFYTADGGVATVPLPFPFVFFGTTYQTLYAGTEGLVTFSDAASIRYAHFPHVLPGSSTPNNLVAVWWQDSQCENGMMKSQVLGTAPNRELVIQWHCHKWLNPSDTWQAQLWLAEGSSVIRVKYGSIVGTSHDGATMGIENAAGTVAVLGLGGTGTPCNDNCDEVNWVPNRMVQYGVSVEPDVMPLVSLGAMTTVGTDLNFPVNLQVRNLGLNPATPLTWNLYRSSDAALDPAADTLLLSHTNAETAVGDGTTPFTDLVTMPRPANGQYWICADLDPDNVIVESNENNNRGCMLTPFLVGSDLLGSISTPNSVGAPGEPMAFNVNIQNQGSDATGNFTYRVWLSADQALQTGLDTLVYTGQLFLQGTDSFTGTVSGLVPANIQGNQFYALLELDPVSPASPVGAVTEAIETNNLATTGSQVTLIKPDLRIDSATYATETTLGCFFDEPVTVTYRICNQGGGNAWGFVNSVLFSTNIVITAPNPPQGDPEADTIPRACLAQDSECGANGVCHLGICHNSCASDAECSDGMVCAPERGDLAFFGKTCQNHLAPGECKTYTRTVTVPTSNPFTGADYVEKDDGYYFAVITDSSTTVNEEIEENNKIAIEPAAMCRFPSPDLAAVTAIPPARMAAGETAAIFRNIRNGGNRGAQVGYRYILSTNETVSANDIPLVLQSTGTDGILDINRNTESQLTDLVRIPAHVAAGEYYLGLIIDPTNAVAELDETNNTFVTSTRVLVDNSALRIVTTHLPDATVGAFYGRQLVAAGGVNAYQWSVNPGELPPGMTLSTDGFLNGAPIDEGTWPFTVHVSSGGVTASAMLALRVGPPMGALAITTPDVLPTAVIGQDYFHRLAAAGGQPEYTWARDSGDLPRTLVVNADGTITGVPVGPAGTSTFTVRVTDEIGNVAKKQFTITVVERDDLFITSQNFQEATAGEEFGGSDACVRAQGGSGQYTWFMDENTLPDGVTYETRDNRGCLVGTPLVCDSFSVSVRVEDNVTGQSDSTELPLTVVCSRVNLTTKRLPDVKRGDTVDQQLTSNAGQGPSFRIFAGRLPAGLTLSPTGHIGGTVAADAAHGTYNFVVEVSDQEGGYGLSGLAITVLADEKPQPKAKVVDDGGCSSASDGATGALPFGIALIGLAAAGFRRRAAVLHRSN